MSNLARKNEKKKEQPKKLNFSTYGAFHQTVEICGTTVLISHCSLCGHAACAS
jgi:hypothetical protein